MAVLETRLNWRKERIGNCRLSSTKAFIDGKEIRNCANQTIVWYEDVLQHFAEHAEEQDLLCPQHCFLVDSKEYIFHFKDERDNCT